MNRSNDVLACTGDIFSRHNTVWVQGVAALSIMLMHFVSFLDGYPRVFNIVGGVGVAAFLFISGFGLNESYIHGDGALGGYWRRRFTRVVLPCWVMFAARLPFCDGFDAGQTLRDFTFSGSQLWFVDFIIRWYVIYWVARRFVPRLTTLLMAGYAVYCLSLSGLQGGQACSFLAGYLVSEHYGRLRRLRHGTTLMALAAVVVWGGMFYVVKLLPAVQAMKGTPFFNLVLLNIMLPLSMVLFLIPWLMPSVKRLVPVNWAGKACFEIYIVHWNFMPFIAGSICRVGVFSLLSVAISAVFYRFDRWIRERGMFMAACSALLFCVIGYVMLLKYSMRVTGWYATVALFYLLVVLCVVMLLCGRYAVGSTMAAWRGFMCGKRMALGLLAVLVVAQFAVQYHFDPMQNNVDRWSAIHNCLDALFDGSFPYGASTHLGGKASPFPAWMLFHVPFWAAGNVGLSEMVTTALFLLGVRMLGGWRAMAMATAMVGLSVNVWYEVAVRSDLISNFMLLAAFVCLLLSRGWTLGRYPYILSACAGIWLSTRLSVAFPLCVLFFADWLKLPALHKLGTVLTAAGACGLTFLPLALWDADALFHAEYTPFVLQTRQGMPGDAPAMVAVAVALALVHRGDVVRLLFCCAMAALSVPVISFLHRMTVRDDWTAVFSSYYDITYLDAALPFLIACVSIAVNGHGCSAGAKLRGV